MIKNDEDIYIYIFLETLQKSTKVRTWRNSFFSFSVLDACAETEVCFVEIISEMLYPLQV